MKAANGHSDWQVRQLGEVIELFDHKRVPLNSRERQQRQGRYPYYGAQGVIDHIDGYMFDGRYILVAEDGENLNSKKLPLALFASGKFWVNNHAHVLRAKPDIADETFVLACLNNADIKPYVTGAAQPKLSQANLRQLKIPLPPLPVQRRIADILSAYDELIENNQRRIKILEEVTRSLYREWFVHFHFPNHDKVKMVPSSLGPIPQGWEVKKLAGLTAFLSRGISPNYDDEGDSIVVNQKCIRDQRLSLEPARRQTKPIPADKCVRFGDVLINSTGVGTLGRVAQVYEVMEQYTVDSHVTIVRRNSDTDVDFFGCALLLKQETFERLGIGATGQTELSRTAIGEIEIPVPPDSLQKRFGALAHPMRMAANTLSKQTENLRRTRDLLLPRLLSGQVDIEAL
jgi:type I restriction enzyme S subunit